MTLLFKPIVRAVVFAFCAACKLSAETLSSQERQEFLESFINHYEFNPEGRYTHEYHPFLLQWTARSFDELERHLRSNNLALRGRIIIMGYEEQSVPPYYTNFKHPKIDDEAIRKNNAGWSLRLHNRFGLMTGFLFKDVAVNAKDSVFKHIDADLIPLFDDRAVLFHEDAFGQALSLLCDRYEIINKLLAQKNHQAILKEIADFWKTLYEHAFMVGNGQIAGTQDVLFSIAYAQYLLRSSLSVKNFFTGPDITYPIEVTCKQHRFATLHAQHFVQTFAQSLQPIDDEKTAYVFCSFVDGVGKSTMLGNIKNWMKWGNAIEKFEHVDNSSSQFAELFQFKDKVYIADLPAQISHFTYKPDGNVFVDARTCMAPTTLQAVETFIKDNKQSLQESYTKNLCSVKDSIAHEGYGHASFSGIANPTYAFLKNVVLLKKETTNVWIPVNHGGKDYLFKDGKTVEIRVLTPLGLVKSEGLKNIEAEQMLFDEGIRFPLPYQKFIDDLVAKLKGQGINNIVFVDFLSMYPRSSRENIRVNYLLQQMALLDDHFDQRLSLYRDFVSGGELLHLLTHDASCAGISNSCRVESLLRLSLFSLVLERKEGNAEGVSIATLTSQLQQGSSLMLDDKKVIDRLVKAKVGKEARILDHVYGLSKSFVNIQQFSLAKAEALYQVLQQFFTTTVSHETINDLWSDMGTPTEVPGIQTEGERLQGSIISDKGVMVRGYFVCNPACKNEFILTPLIRSLRACWYASLLNLFGTTSMEDGFFEIDQEYYRVVPLVAQTINGLVYVMQRALNPCETAIPVVERLLYRQFRVVCNKPIAFTMIDDAYYRLEWESCAIGFACQRFHEDDQTTPTNQTAVTALVNKYQRQYGRRIVLPTSELWDMLVDSDAWKLEQEDIQTIAKQMGWYKGPSTENNHEIMEPCTSQGLSRVYKGTQFYRRIAQTLVRLFATLEMVLKDPDADIVIRDGNRDDFAAALKLLEKVVLPMHCAIYFNQDLFDDYNHVEPYPSWAFWDKFER